jgi:hypothetical protein
MNLENNIKYINFIKVLISLFLISVFTYTFYFSLSNIINYWTYSEIHINYSLGFSKRGLLGSIMLYLENYGLSKRFFFSTIFYLATLFNIFLFLSLINRFKKNHICVYIFFALNPGLLLFSFYDLGGYARSEIFGISVCLLHTLFAQKFYYHQINYRKYLKLILIIIYPTALITVLIHELNILFLCYHFLTTFLIIKKKFKEITAYKYLIFLNLISLIFILYLLFTHPFTKEFAEQLYDNLKNKDNTSFWIWDAISRSLTERINIEIKSMQDPKGAISLYFFIFLFYFFPTFFFLKTTTKKNKFQFFLTLLSIVPFFTLFFIGRDWGRWIHIILIILFSCFLQFREKKMNLLKNWKYKLLTFILTGFLIFQFTFTRIPHCCNLKKLNLNVIGGLIPKIEVFSKILNNKIDIKNRFQVY